jgi:hypothetical protein
MHDEEHEIEKYAATTKFIYALRVESLIFDAHIGYPDIGCG